MKTIRSLILPLLATLPFTLAQSSSSSSSTLHIPGPMEQSVTALSGTRSVTATSSTSDSSSPTVSIPGPMEQSITTSASDSSTTVEPAVTASSSATTSSSSSSSEAPGGGDDATRTGVSQSQGTSGAEAMLGSVKLEQMVMMGLGLGAALAV
ncbi:hypothetical protein PRZ48_003872 [Zasmidium cellare]|uniref:GPI anchored protein n=1 Tax=Zasmidium cellare TaxID=395010 RepID=A0ABR0EWA6_ZASCE|nr:hypothetical protein PRZ48_003872 [Zasmidium cellare]